MLPHEERVVVEKQELDEKIAKLEAFTKTEACFKLPFKDRDLLMSQFLIMTEYSHILGARIHNFKEQDNV